MKNILFILVILQVSCTSVNVKYEDEEYLAKVEKARREALKVSAIIYREVVGGEVIFTLR